MTCNCACWMLQILKHFESYNFSDYVSFSCHNSVRDFNVRTFSADTDRNFPSSLDKRATTRPTTMTELLKVLQSGNGSFHSDLMQGFVARSKGDYSKTGASPGSSFSEVTTSNLNQNVNTGACIFTTSPSTTTTTTTSSHDEPDNANILQTQRVTDNHTTTTAAGPTSTDTTSFTDNGSSQLIFQTRDIPATTATMTTDTNVNANVNMNRLVAPLSVASPELPDRNANVSEVAAILEEVRSEVSEGRRQLLQQVTEAAVDSHMATSTNTHRVVQEATARFLALKDTGGLPDVSKLSLSPSTMWQQFTAQMKPELTKCIKFCKMLPGFSELCLEDQMQLIKQGSFEVMITRFCMLVDHEKETMLDPSHKMCCPRHIVREMPMGQFLESFFYIASKFNPIGLTDGEIGLFTAVLIFCPSRSNLTDSKVVAKIQSLYQQALFTLIKQNHTDPEAKFTQVLGVVPVFRRINEEHTKALSAMKMQAPENFDKHFPPLHRELYEERT